MTLTGEAKKEYQLRWIKQRREDWLKEHGPCVVCGSWDQLEVDHIDPSMKTMNPAKLWSLSPKNPVRIVELDKCQVLCYACHQEKTKNFLSEKYAGTGTRQAALTDATLEEVRRRLAQNDRGVDIARDLGVSKYVVSRVKRGIAYQP